MPETISKLKDDIESKIKEFKIQTDKLQTEFENSIQDLSRKGYKIEKDKIVNFMEKFWHTYPTKNPNEWEVVIPIFIPFNIGWFDRTDGGYNVFTINKYTKWLGEDIPTFISHEMNLPPSFKLQMDGNDLEFEEGKEEEIENRFGKHLTLIEKNKAKIKQGHEFDLLAEIIDAGFLPFKTKQVSKEDLMESDFTQIWDELDEKYKPLNLFDGKYSYQGNAWSMFEKYGSLGIFWAMSFGKTVIGTYIFSKIKGKKCLVVPTTTLKEHWEQFLKWNCPRLLNEIEIFTYQGMSRKSWIEISKKEYSVVGFDECHFLPADSFSKLASINTKYRFGLCMSPNTMIDVCNGRKKIKELKIGDMVASFNFKKRIIEYKPVIGISLNLKEKTLIKISTKNGIRKMVCSPEHKIFSNGQFIEAKALSSGSTVIIKA